MIPATKHILAAAIAALALLPTAGLGQSGEPTIAEPVAPQAIPNRAPLTRDQLRNARPMPIPELSEDEARRLFRGRLPPRDTTTPRPEPLSTGNIKDKPLKWAGKLYHEVGGLTYSCSAQFIEPKIIVTAAHCVVEDNGAAGPLSFYLQYVDGDYSKFYPVANGLYWQNYLTDGFDRWRWDYAILCVAQSSKTGNFGFRTLWKDAYDQATAIGYPAAIKNGDVIQVVSGNLTQYEPGVYELNHGVSKFTQGASGGAWVGDYSKGDGKNEVLSVNSFILGGRSGRMYGPYFDKNFSKLLKQVKQLPGC